MSSFLGRDNTTRSRLVDCQHLYVSSSETEADLHPRLTKLQHLIKYDIVPKNPDIFDAKQSTNDQKALALQDRLIESRRPLSLSVVSAYHSLCLTGDDTPVPYRDFEVFIAKNPHFKAMPATKINDGMREFIEQYKSISRQTREIIPALELATYVYCEIINMQPYEDGNSRTAMMSMVHVLRQFNTGINRMPHTFDFRFIQLTKGAKKRNDSEVTDLLKELCLLRCNQSEIREMFRCR